MTTELIMIDLLAEKKTIHNFYKKNYHKRLKLISLITGGSLLFFWGVATLVYYYSVARIGIPQILTRLANLYQLSLGIGGIILVLGLLSLLVVLFQLLIFKPSFPRWLNQQATKVADMTVGLQDKTYFYLTKSQRKIQIVKSSSNILSTTLDGQQIMIGQTPAVFGFYQVNLFILTTEPLNVMSGPKPKVDWQKRILLGFSLVAVIGVVSSYYYLRGSYRFSLPASDEVVVEETVQSTPLNEAGLVSQTGTAPTYKMATANELYLDNETGELFSTTDAGESWQFVPIKAEWLRGGDYTLTTGTIPWGYWMDNTFEISPTFSWFLYSPDDLGLYFLSSKDNGQTWQSQVISEDIPRIRYRKGQFFPDGSGVVIFSTDGGMSSESIWLYHTGDYGENWSGSTNTSISAPIQNASFLSQAKGFLATRNDLYYTENYGRSFKDAVITIPADYRADGLDIFQSPNEVVERSSALLEGKFNLVKDDGIDIGKMFACLFQSVDGGQTWTFVKQLSQIEQED